ncbi:MAG: hypothetical protein GIKADHBN_02347 [Phycisphaerales bacterium]|nr:hypothetical protein [Phycisphaerales bacterium]
MNDAESIRDQIAKRLRAAREQAGLSQGQVAKLMHWHRPTVSQIEAGQRRVSAEELSLLAGHYRVSIAWLTKSTESTSVDPQIELAAKELSKLAPDDLQRVIRLLNIVKKKDAVR